MAAISTTFLALARAGERVAVQRELYGGSTMMLREVLSGLGIEIVWLDRGEIADLEPGKLEGCRLLYLESPINPSLRLIDLRAAASVAREAGVPVAVDSTFATPILQRPVEMGIDLVIHSATKYLGGHSDLTGGVVAGRRELIQRIADRRRVLGGTLDPFASFLLYRGLRTLAVRMDAQCRGAEAVARVLEAHDRVQQVYYPGLESHPDHELARRQMDGFGGMVSFVVEEAVAAPVHDALRLFAKAGSLGGVESLVSLPSCMSHRGLSVEERASVGIPPGLLRLSIGLESPTDLIGDLVAVLDSAT